MNDIDFNRFSDQALNVILEGLEEADRGGAIEIELQNGVMTIELSAGRTLIVSKHVPSKQLWYSSPVAGGLHFSYMGEAWVLGDGRTLLGTLKDEIQSMTGLEVEF